MDDPAQSPAPPVVNTSDDLNQLTKDPLPTFTEEVKQFESTHGKEQEPPVQSGRAGEQESVSGIDIQEIPNSPEIEKDKELGSYMEKIEKEAELTNPVTDDYTQQVLLKSTANQNPVITLPLTEEQVHLGLHHQVWEAITWLAVWCFRQVKLLPGRVKYKQ